MHAPARIAMRTALVLLAFAVTGAFLLSGTHLLTEPTIKASEEAARNAMIAEVLPAGSFDNDLQQSRRDLSAPGKHDFSTPSGVYTARLKGKTTGIVFESVAPEGYSGNIYLLVGVLPDGRLAGVRVTQHKETPGLGDYIEIAKSSWINQFAGRSLGNPPEQDWKVQKDGGIFMYYAGATITPRAVVKAVKQTLDYYQQHQSALLSGQGGTP